MCVGCLEVSRKFASSVLHSNESLWTFDVAPFGEPGINLRWVPGAWREATRWCNGFKIPAAPTWDPSPSGPRTRPVVQGLPEDKLHLSTTAKQLDALLDQYGQKHNQWWATGYSRQAQHFFFFRYFASGRTAQVRWCWPIAESLFATVTVSYANLNNRW